MLVDTNSGGCAPMNMLLITQPHRLWEEYDDELIDIETVNNNTYDDPFDSKEEKIKDSKILIDELDLPGSRTRYTHSCITIMENTIRVTPDKNVKKLSNASLILEDFNPPLYELPFHKEVPGSETLLLIIHSEIGKLSTPGFSLLTESSYSRILGRELFSSGL
ncbi:hypothetical protein Tco_0294237 [Tanacetum coccineum]